MKKLSFMLLSLLAVTMFTACNNDDDETSRKQTITSPMNCRVVDASDGSVVFSQNTAKVELNYTDMTINFTCNYKDLNGQTQVFTSPVMKLSLEKGSVYRIETVGGQVISTNGWIDMSTGMMWYKTSDSEEGTVLVMTTHLLYAYTTTTMTNTENGNHGSHDQSAYLFALDSKGETCIMKIYNFISNLNAAIDAAEVQYEGLTVTPTGTGYTITASEVESNYKGFYKLTDVNFTLNEQCLVTSGSFKCNGLEYTVSGQLFPLN